MTDRENLLKRAEAVELEAGRTDEADRRADLLQIAICLKWLSQRDTIDPRLMKRLTRTGDRHA